MNVLIGCECSGRVRDAFLALGHDAWSCDLKPIEGSRAGNHIVGDVRPVMNSGWFEGYDIRTGRDGRHFRRWDLGIFHPDCTYLTNSAAWAFKDGPYHQDVKPGTLVGEARRAARAAAVDFVLEIYNCPIPRIAIENPIGSLSTLWRKADQIVHPYLFGDDASKATCFWLRGLKPLTIDPKQYFPPRLVCDDCGTNFKHGEHKCPSCYSQDFKPRWGNQTDSGQNKLSPSDDRAAVRAVTYPGIANAMAEQWGVPT